MLYARCTGETPRCLKSHRLRRRRKRRGAGKRRKREVERKKVAKRRRRRNSSCVKLAPYTQAPYTTTVLDVISLLVTLLPYSPHTLQQCTRVRHARRQRMHAKLYIARYSLKATSILRYFIKAYSTIALLSSLGFEPFLLENKAQFSLGFRARERRAMRYFIKSNQKKTHIVSNSLEKKEK